MDVHDAIKLIEERLGPPPIYTGKVTDLFQQLQTWMDWSAKRRLIETLRQTIKDQERQANEARAARPPGG